MEKRMSHWVPPFVKNGPNNTQLSYCGKAWVSARDYSTEPTCRDCQALLLDDADTIQAIEAEFPEWRDRIGR